MKARAVMSRPVVSVRPHMPAREAAGLLLVHGFTAAPVVDAEGRILGIATEADLMRDQVLPDEWELAPPPDVPVSTVMTPGPFMMAPEDDLADVVAFMLAHGIRSVPIVEHGLLVGIISRRDVLRCVARRELTAAEVLARRGGAARS